MSAAGSAADAVAGKAIPLALPARKLAARISPAIGLGAVAVLFGPTLLALRGRLLGLEYVDAYGTQWMYAFVGNALAAGRSPLHTDLLAFPWGTDLYAQSGGNVLDAALATPFRAILGPVAGYNAFVLVGMGLGVLAMYRFAAEVLADRRAACTVAVLFGIQPWPLLELAYGRPTQALLPLLVVFLHLLWRLGTRPGWRDGLGAGLVLALVGSQYWFYAVFGVAVALAHGLARARRPPEGAGSGRRMLARHALALGAAAVLAAPGYLPLLMATGKAGGVPGMLDSARWTLGHTPPRTVDGAQVTLQEWQPLAGWLGYHVARFKAGERFLRAARLGALPMAATFAAWLWRPGRLSRGPVIAMVAVAVGIAMGPVLIAGPWVLPNLPYLGALHLLPFLRRLWWPARAFAILAVLWPLMAGAVLAGLGDRWRLRALLTLALVGSELVALSSDGILPFPTWEPDIEAGYRCLAHAEGGAVIDLPYGWSQRHLYAQTLHGHPILGGMNEGNPAFAPAGLREAEQRNPVLAALTSPLGLEGADATLWSKADVATIGALGYRWIVLQRDAFVPRADAQGMEDTLLRSQERETEQALVQAFGQPVYQDARMLLWAPWGGGSPCAGDEPVHDAVRLGRTEVSALPRADEGIPLSGEGRIGAGEP